MNKTLKKLMGLLLLCTVAAITLAGTATARFDAPLPPGVNHARLEYTTNDLWWSGGATWFFSRNATNMPALPWTNGLTGAVSNRLTLTLSNVPPTITAARVAYVYTNGEVAATAAAPVFGPGDLRIEVGP